MKAAHFTLIMRKMNKYVFVILFLYLYYSFICTVIRFYIVSCDHLLFHVYYVYLLGGARLFFEHTITFVHLHAGVFPAVKSLTGKKR